MSIDVTDVYQDFFIWNYVYIKKYHCSIAVSLQSEIVARTQHPQCMCFGGFMSDYSYSGHMN